MDRKWIKTIAIITACGWVFSGPIAYAESAGDQDAGSKGKYEQRKGEGFFKDLNLTAEQKEKLKTYRESQKEKNQAVREQLKTKMQALHEAMTQPEVDQAKINGLVAEINTLKGQLFAQHVEGLLGMKEVLTQEQFNKLQERRQERKNGKHGKRHGGWGQQEQAPEGSPEEN